VHRRVGGRVGEHPAVRRPAERLCPRRHGDVTREPAQSVSTRAEIDRAARVADLGGQATAVRRPRDLDGGGLVRDDREDRRRDPVQAAPVGADDIERPLTAAPAQERDPAPVRRDRRPDIGSRALGQIQTLAARRDAIRAVKFVLADTQPAWNVSAALPAAARVNSTTARIIWVVFPQGMRLWSHPFRLNSLTMGCA